MIGKVIGNWILMLKGLFGIVWFFFMIWCDCKKRVLRDCDLLFFGVFFVCNLCVVMVGCWCGGLWVDGVLIFKWESFLFVGFYFV